MGEDRSINDDLCDIYTRRSDMITAWAKPLPISCRVGCRTNNSARVLLSTLSGDRPYDE